MKIVVLDGYTLNPGDLEWKSLEKLGELTVYDRTPADDEREIIARIGDAQAIYTNKTPITRAVLDACPSVQFIGVLAIIEMAAAAGLTLTKHHQNVESATTYGVGEIICDAVKRGCKRFIIGIGGSSTNDCGIGMLTALGVRFLDAQGNQVGIGAEDTGRVQQIEVAHMLPELLDCDFQVACDVNNALNGTEGATYIYGPQKGLPEAKLAIYDKYHKSFAQCVEQVTGRNCSNEPGAGAAGGLGFALMSFLNAKLNAGIDLVMRGVGLDVELQNADYVITGEGRLDHQTVMGKAPIGVAKYAKQHGATVIALAGSVAEGAKPCNGNGIDAFFSILKEAIPIEKAMQTEIAEHNIADISEQVFRLILEEHKKHHAVKQ